MSKNNDEEVEKVLSLGEASVVSINPQFQHSIIHKQMNDIMIEMKKHLSKKKNFHIIMVKE